MLDALLDRRQRLRQLGYLPLPLHGKTPPLLKWQTYTVISSEMLKLWTLQVWPTASNTGCLTRYMPAIDIDILHEEAARAVEDMISAEFCERGVVLVRVGRAPKRAIIFKTDAPYKKITVPLTSPHGSKEEKIELLADGQQIVVDGIHPDTGKPYTCSAVPYGTVRAASCRPSTGPPRKRWSPMSSRC
jgi:hypothetical protein